MPGSFFESREKRTTMESLVDSQELDNLGGGDGSYNGCSLLAQMMAKSADAFESLDIQNPSSADLIFDLFKVQGKDEASVGKLLAVLRSFGIQENDPRLREVMANIREYERLLDEEQCDRRLHLNREQFRKCVTPSVGLISSTLRNQLVIPNWAEFTAQIEKIFLECKENQEGDVASYIPQLARVDGSKWGMSICTIDGQRFSLGSATEAFCVQSISKAFNYAIVATDSGSDFVHDFVGHEPSGRHFNDICLNSNGKPHNPLVNAGAIVVTSLLKKDCSMADRFDYVMNRYKAMAGGGYVGFNNATFLSERETADRNYALAHYMKEKKCFPPEIPALRDVLDFYFQLCSIETNCESAAVMAATLANGGVCPLTNDKVIAPRPCRDVLSLMYSCGMYDYSGEFAFKIGLPAKSGVSGAMIVVVPNLMGICLWSPRLEHVGNSCRGVRFCEKLIATFNFHNYDSLLHTENNKSDPRRRIGNKETDVIVSLLYAVKNGDFKSLRRLYMNGVDMNITDYDGRSALHLAACENQLTILKFLLNKCNANPAIRDRWGHTALDEARRCKHTDCVRALKKVTPKDLAKKEIGDETPMTNHSSDEEGGALIAYEDEEDYNTMNSYNQGLVDHMEQIYPNWEEDKGSDEEE